MWEIGASGWFYYKEMCEVLVRLQQTTRYQVQDKGRVRNKNISKLMPQNTCVISGFRPGVNEIFALLGCYIA